MEAVIDCEYLSGAYDEKVIKEVSVAADNALETFRLLPPSPWRLIAPQTMV
jgi:hypothetical protein